MVIRLEGWTRDSSGSPTTAAWRKPENSNINIWTGSSRAWHLDGVDTPEKALAGEAAAKKKTKAGKDTSMDLDAYENMVMQYVPVYRKD